MKSKSMTPQPKANTKAVIMKKVQKSAPALQKKASDNGLQKKTPQQKIGKKAPMKATPKSKPNTPKAPVIDDDDDESDDDDEDFSEDDFSDDDEEVYEEPSAPKTSVKKTPKSEPLVKTLFEKKQTPQQKAGAKVTPAKSAAKSTPSAKKQAFDDSDDSDDDDDDESDDEDDDEPPELKLSVKKAPKIEALVKPMVNKKQTPQQKAGAKVAPAKSAVKTTPSAKKRALDDSEEPPELKPSVKKTPKTEALVKLNDNKQTPQQKAGAKAAPTKSAVKTTPSAKKRALDDSDDSGDDDDDDVDDDDEMESDSGDDVESLGDDDDDDDDSSDDDEDEDSKEVEDKEKEVGLSSSAILDEVTKKRDERDKRTLYVRNLPVTVTPEDVKKLSSDIVDVRLKVLHLNSRKKAKGYCFVEFNSEKIAENNFKKLQGTKLGENVIEVDYCGRKSLNIKPQARPKPEQFDPCRLYISSLPSDVTEDSLKTLFSTASDISLPTLRITGKPMGFAFAGFANADLAKKAHDSMQGKKVKGKLLVVMYSKVKSMNKGKAEPKKPTPAKKAKVAPAASSSEDEDSDDDDESEDDDDDDESESD